MPVTLRSLLAHSELGLRLDMAADAGVLDREIAWVHSSDLADPTPWLEAGQLLLTDGSQFAVAGESHAGVRIGSGRGAMVTDAAAYVARFVDAGIVGLGFAVGVVHESVPVALAEACRDAGLPLVLIPARVPFIRVIRHVAEVIAAERSARVTWSVAAQRALARATLQPDGLGATLRELEVQLSGWVALYDRLGRRVEVRTTLEPPAEQLPLVADEVEQTLERGRRAATRLSGDGYDITLQTIGQHEQLRGVLVVGAAMPLDPAARDLIASVIGIASIAIEQSRDLDRARRELRQGVLELYLAGETDAAGRVLSELGAWAPGPRVEVAAIVGIENWDAALDEFELRARSAPFFFARYQAGEADELVLVWTSRESGRPADVDAGLAEAVARGLRVGVSGRVALTDLAEGFRQARRAAARAAAGGIVEYGRLAEQGIVAWLELADGAVPAAALLAPLRARSDADLLLASARAWFEHNCAWDPAARELGIHRHTLRARIDTIGETCGLEVGDFAARVELWAALQLGDQQ